MPSGEHLDHQHQTRVGSRPRPGKIGAKANSKKRIMEIAPPPSPDEDLSADADGNMTIDGETLDAATLRLQISRANAQESDAAKKKIELDALRGKMMTKEQAVDLGQEAVLRVVGILDLLTESLRDRLEPGATYARDEVCILLDDEIHRAREKVASGGR